MGIRILYNTDSFNKKHHLAMKSIIVAALIGTAAAFAPAQTGKVSTLLHASAAVEFAPQPLGFFNPLDMPRGAEKEDIACPTDGEIAKKEEFGLAATVLDIARTAVEEAYIPASVFAMKVVSSIGSMKRRSKDCQIVRRRGRIYVISKNGRF